MRYMSESTRTELPPVGRYRVNWLLQSCSSEANLKALSAQNTGVRVSSRGVDFMMVIVLCI